MGASISKQTQRFTFSVESLDIMDYLTKNSSFGYLLESRCLENTGAKSCINAQFKYDTASPTSDLSLVLTNNCNLLFCVNFHTIFTLATYFSEAVFKENIETAYYAEFARAAFSKIDQYIQLGIAFAVSFFSNQIRKMHIIVRR